MGKRRRFTDQQDLAASPEELFQFFMVPTNLEKIMAATMDVKVRHTTHDPLQEGAVIDYTFKQFGAPIKWRSRIAECVPNEYFVDEQVEGPFKYWRHRHGLEPVPGGTRVTDDLTLELPFGPLGDLAYALVVKNQMQTAFKQRMRVMEQIFGPASGGAPK